MPLSKKRIVFTTATVMLVTMAFVGLMDSLRDRGIDPQRIVIMGVILGGVAAWTLLKGNRT